MQKKVRNTSGQTLTIVGVGVVRADEVVDVPADFHNGNFEAVKSKSQQRHEDVTKGDMITSEKDK